MNDPLIYRSILFALFEFFLILAILRHGKFQVRLIGLLLFFLAGYQLGEFIFLSTNNSVGIQLATISTTLLPPLGLAVVEKIVKKNYGALALQILGIFFVLIFIFNPNILTGSKEYYCLVKYSTISDLANPIIFAWGAYYLSTLTYTVIVLIKNILNKQNMKVKKILTLALISYICFYPISYLLAVFFNLNLGILASLMCALAIICAGFMSYISIQYDDLLEK